MIEIELEIEIEVHDIDREGPLFLVPYSRSPIPGPLFPVPYSRSPIPGPLFPVPWSWSSVPSPQSNALHSLYLLRPFETELNFFTDN